MDEESQDDAGTGQDDNVVEESGTESQENTDANENEELEANGNNFVSFEDTVKRGFSKDLDPEGQFRSRGGRQSRVVAGAAFRR